jgi:hypothetical protein
MKILNDNSIHLKFLMDLSVNIEGIGNLHSPYLTEIADITEECYNQSISTFLFDKKNLENQSQFAEYSNFQVLLLAIYQDSSFREFFFNGLKLHLDSVPSLHPEGFVYFGELSEESVLTEEKFNYLKKLVSIANNISEKTEEEKSYDFATDEAKSFWEKLKRKRELAAKNTKKEEKINLHSIISAVGWKAESFTFINKLNIYQLYNGFSRLRVIDNYKYNMTGIYTGSIDSSKIKMPDIDWANIIKTN